MLLRNYYSCLASFFSPDTQSFSVHNYNNTMSSRTISYLQDGLKFSYALRYIGTSASSQGVVFGTGREPVKLDDYRLSGSYLSNLTGSINHTTTFNADNNIIETTAIITVTNGSSSVAVVGEMGLNVMIYGFAHMIDRTLLEEPISIPPGEIAKITYKLKFTYPNPD